MGFNPIYSVVSIGVPKNTEVESIKHLYKGMLKATKQNGGEIVGGDTVRSSLITINISMIGVRGKENNQKTNFLSRSNAIPKDSIAVTGYLGNSAAGFDILKNPQKLEEKIITYLSKSHLRPQPKVQTGITLCNNGIKSAIDISDGFMQDITRICKSSNVGAKIEVSKIPVHKYLKKAFPLQLNHPTQIMETIEINLINNKKFRASEIIADLKSISEALYFPMKMVGFGTII